MTAFADALQPFCLWLLRVSWQTTVVVALVLAAQALFGSRLSAPWRYRLWALALVRLLLPVSLAAPFSIFNAPVFDAAGRLAQPEAASGRVTYEIEPARDVPALPELGAVSSGAWVVRTAPPERWRPPLGEALELVWLAGALLLAGRIVWVNYRLAARIRRDAPRTDLSLLRLVEACRRSSGVRRPLWVVETGAVRSPSLFGYSIPKLLLPEGMVARFTDEELGFIVLHELEHVRHRDIALNWLLALLQVLHWFNPALWLAFSRFRADREAARDARVLERVGEERATAYGRTVLKLIQDFSRAPQAPGLAGILEAHTAARRRISMIAGFRSRTPRSAKAAALAAAAALALVGLTDARNRDSGSRPRAAAPVRALELRVVDRDSGRPLEGVAVGADTRTDRDGRCTVEGGVASLLPVRSPGYALRWVPLPTGRSSLDPTLVALERGETIGGIVADLQGRPIQDATVNLIGPTGPELLATTGPGGEWSSSEVSLRFGKIQLEVIHPEYVEVLYRSESAPPRMQTREPLRTVPLEDLKARKAVMVLHRGLTVAGIVVDARGSPIPRAEVRQVRARASQTERTDREGRFAFRNGSIGKMNLAIEARGFAPELQTVWVIPSMAPARIRLSKGSVLRGLVVDPDGNPIAGARVLPVEAFRWRGATDHTGRFRWDPSPARPIDVRVFAEGFLTTVRPLSLEPGEREHRIELRPAAEVSVHGTVLDAETGAPIPEFRVSSALARAPDGWYGYQAAASGKNGSFDLTLRGFFSSCSIRVEADGYRPDSSRVVEWRRGAARVEVRLVPARSLCGTVLLSDGRPAAGATLLLADRHSPMLLSDTGAHGSQEHSRTAVADSSGRFTFQPLEDPATVVAAHDRGFAVVPFAALQSPARMVLAPWGRVQGIVSIGSRPPGAVTLSNRFGSAGAPVLPLDLSAPVSAAGRFVFERVPAGEYWIERAYPGGVVARGAGPGVSVTVRAGEATSVRLGGRGRPIVGKVALVAPHPPLRWKNGRHTLETLPGPERRSYPVEFAADGSYRVEDVPAGKYLLKIQMAGFPDNTLRREVIVPEIPGGRTDSPLNLGTMTIR